MQPKITLNVSTSPTTRSDLKVGLTTFIKAAASELPKLQEELNPPPAITKPARTSKRKPKTA